MLSEISSASVTTLRLKGWERNSECFSSTQGWIFFQEIFIIRKSIPEEILITTLLNRGNIYPKCLFSPAQSVFERIFSPVWPEMVWTYFRIWDDWLPDSIHTQIVPTKPIRAVVRLFILLLGDCYSLHVITNYWIKLTRNTPDYYKY